MNELVKAGKDITRTSGMMTWIKLNDETSLFWINSDGNASCLSVEGKGWSSRVSTVKHLRSVLA